MKLPFTVCVLLFACWQLPCEVSCRAFVSTNNLQKPIDSRQFLTNADLSRFVNQESSGSQKLKSNIANKEELKSVEGDIKPVDQNLENVGAKSMAGGDSLPLDATSMQEMSTGPRVLSEALMSALAPQIGSKSDGGGGLKMKQSLKLPSTAAMDMASGGGVRVESDSRPSLPNDNLPRANVEQPLDAHDSSTKSDGEEGALDKSLGGAGSEPKSEDADKAQNESTAVKGKQGIPSSPDIQGQTHASGDVGEKGTVEHVDLAVNDQLDAAAAKASTSDGNQDKVQGKSQDKVTEKSPNNSQPSASKEQESDHSLVASTAPVKKDFEGALAAGSANNVENETVLAVGNSSVASAKPAGGVAGLGKDRHPSQDSAVGGEAKKSSTTGSGTSFTSSKGTSALITQDPKLTSTEEDSLDNLANSLDDVDYLESTKEVVQTPADKVVAPGDGVVAPGDGVVAPGDGVVAPGDGVVAPGDGVVAPGDGVVAPGDGVVAPGDGVVAPGDGVVVLEDGVEASKDEVGDGVGTPGEGVQSSLEGHNKVPTDDKMQGIFLVGPDELDNTPGFSNEDLSAQKDSGFSDGSGVSSGVRVEEFSGDGYSAESDAESHFGYLVFLTVGAALGYLLYLKRKKVLALLLEGRRSSTGSRRGSIGSRRPRSRSSNSGYSLLRSSGGEEPQLSPHSKGSSEHTVLERIY